MAVTTASFRGHFPAFNDGDRFPNPVVDYWVGIGVNLVNAARWGNLTDSGVELFVAHNLTLERRAMDEADRGGIPGISQGPINNKSVDKVSVGYDTSSAAELDAGHWNLTIYGVRFVRLARMMGAGGLQVGTTPDELAASGPWAGPWPSLFPNPTG